MDFALEPLLAHADFRPSGRRARRAVIAVFVGFALFLVAGNLSIAAAWKLESFAKPSSSIHLDISNFEVVDGTLWRGAAPDEHAYRELAKHGVRTIVDLRAEDGTNVDENLLTSLGIRRVRIPMRDGQAPTRSQVRRFLDVVTRSRGRVFVHCGAGVGRTGTMVAAYLVATGQADGREAMRRNLEVGPPSLEQLAFASALKADSVPHVNPAIVATSRVLDAPRRIWISLH